VKNRRWTWVGIGIFATLVAAGLVWYYFIRLPEEPVEAAEFKDRAAANAEVSAAQMPLVFTGRHGETISLDQYRGKKNVVLVVMRGLPRYLCLYCLAQTGSLIRNYGDITRRNAEVLVVFPGTPKQTELFLSMARGTVENASVPFPVAVDENFKAVDQLGIRGDLAKPSTYVLDKQGQVRYAYVGASRTDRPSVKAVLAQLDKLQ
jgi:peroxiredoxin